MYTRAILALSLGSMVLGSGCVVEPIPEPTDDFERFRRDWGYGFCIPEADCSGYVELRADGTLRFDAPCPMGMECDGSVAGSYQVMLPAEERDAAVAALTGDDLKQLLDRDDPPCTLPEDVSETMTLETSAGSYSNATTLCEDAAIQAAREVVDELIVKYFADPPVRLVSAGWSFGFCIGGCVGEVALAGTELHYVVSDPQDESVYLDTTATLTEAGQQELTSALAELHDVSLDERYGCPDCADGGASFVTLSRNGDTSTHTYEYGNPPPVLDALDTLLDELIDAIESCSSTALVEIPKGCEPRE